VTLHPMFGYEGLVIRAANGKWYRVKPEYTADVYITGWFEQLNTAKEPKGQLGGFDTNYGKVTAFTEELRRELWDNPGQFVGRLMEVRWKYSIKNFMKLALSATVLSSYVSVMIKMKKLSTLRLVKLYLGNTIIITIECM